MVKSLKIKTLVHAAILAPVLVAVAFGGHTALKQYQTYTAVHDTRHLMHLAGDISAVIHELQKERGSSNGYIGSKGSDAFSRRLSEQRAATDGALEHLEQELSEFEVDRYEASFGERLGGAGTELKKLPAKRQAL